jgi:hypothetical protein
VNTLHKGDDDDDDNNNNQYLLTCRLNSKSAYYKASTKHNYNTKQHRCTKQTLNKQTNKQKKTILQEKIYKSTGAKPLYSEEIQINLFKNVPVQRKICFKEVTGFLKIK